MKEADQTADILFHAAMAIGSSRKSGVISAIFDACKYLEIENPFTARGSVIRLYGSLFGHIGDAWPVHFSMTGGRWISNEAKMELLTTLLFAYEYVVQEMGGARSSADPTSITFAASTDITFGTDALRLDYS